MNSALPPVGSYWLHTNGNIYKVLLIANEQSERLDEYPVTVVYQNVKNKLIWSRTLSNWHRSMTPEVPDVQYES